MESDEQQPAVRGDVLTHEVHHERRLARTGRPDEVHVLGRVARCERDRTAHAALGVAEHLSVSRGRRRWRDRPRAGACDPGDVPVDRQVRERRELQKRVEIAAAKLPAGNRHAGATKAAGDERVVTGVGRERGGERTDPARLETCAPAIGIGA